MLYLKDLLGRCRLVIVFILSLIIGVHQVNSQLAPLFFSSDLPSDALCEPAYFGEAIYSRCYQDDTYTGLYYVCEYNTCTCQEFCLAPTTDYCVESYRSVISCGGGSY
jgi:hypothetical protein